MFTANSDDEIFFLKIGQHMAKLWAKGRVSCFFDSLVVCNVEQ